MDFLGVFLGELTGFLTGLVVLVVLAFFVGLEGDFLSVAVDDAVLEMPVGVALGAARFFLVAAADNDDGLELT